MCVCKIDMHSHIHTHIWPCGDQQQWNAFPRIVRHFSNIHAFIHHNHINHSTSDPQKWEFTCADGEHSVWPYTEANIFFLVQCTFNKLSFAPLARDLFWAHHIAHPSHTIASKSNHLHSIVWWKIEYWLSLSSPLTRSTYPYMHSNVNVT